MIVPPFAAPEDFSSALHPKDEKEAHWFIFAGDQLLITCDKSSLPNNNPFTLKRSLYMGTLGNRHLFAGEAKTKEEAPQGWLWSHLRSLHGIIDEEHYAIAGRAFQLIDWDRSHQYCGCCGAATFLREYERCRECNRCGHLAYPKLAPAIMALVTNGEKLLLARSPHFPDKMYSVIAGFVDPGETLEQCVKREVFEEVGVDVKNICYFGSQPWPFSRSLLIAFTCEWESGEIHIDPLEIEEAAWFDSAHLPQLPSHLSMARILIDSKIKKPEIIPAL